MPDDSYPDAPRQHLVDMLPAGAPAFEIADPYRWLEDAGSDATQRWLTAQDVLLERERARWPGRAVLRDRVTQLLGAGVVGAPVWRGDRYFFMRRTAEQDHAVLHTVDADGRERVLLDPMHLDATGRTTLDAWQPSKEGRLLAYQLSEGGDEESTLQVMDVASGERVDGPIDRTRYSPVAWLPGGEAYYYVRRLPASQVPVGEEQYHRRVWLHRVGTDADDDVLVFGDGRDKTSYYGVSVSMDGRWLAVSAAEGTAPRNDLWLADLVASGAGAPRLVTVTEGLDAQTSCHVGRDGRLYVMTDLDAPRGRLAVTDPSTPTSDAWEDLLPEDPEAVLDGYAVLDGDELASPLLVAAWTRHAVGEVTVHDLTTGQRQGSIPLPGVGSLGGLTEHPEGGHEAWLGYTDAVTPSSVLRYDARSGELTTWATAPGTVAVPSVWTTQLAYRSTDGTVVHLQLVAPADAVDADGRPDRPRPTVLYGYGGFGVSMTPGYSAGVLTWAEAGGVYAVAGLRGGGEEGEDWRRAGMLANKQNVFDDFYAAAEHLVAQGWTTRRQLAISGGSNGGLLVGAALTQRPELFAAVVCSAPLLDMVRYELFGLGATWASEYGTASDVEQLGDLLAYSPYHRVRDGVAYPAVLFEVFDSDTRVDPLHARKLCAALQHATSRSVDQAPILLRRETDVGHGARAVSRSVELTADSLAFMARQTGLRLEARR